jgi:aryl-alcohol dehydrogenase-like predicted oxidoreductase
MPTRTFGRLGWQVGELGYGMWGMGGWTESDDAQSRSSLQLAVNGGCTFFDTAWAYGSGHSEKLLGELLKANSGKRLYAATKIPPKNLRWPTRRGDKLDDAFPPEHIREYTEKSLSNLGVSCVDLTQFHVWEDDWALDTGWQNAVADLKRQGLIKAIGVSVNRWEPWNTIKTLRTGLIDAVQVIYNIFDQSPEDELFPVCRELKVAVIARVPFDEGSLTGNLTKESRWPQGDWRNTYFAKDNLQPTLDRIEAIKKIVPAGMTLPEMAIRFILSNPDVTTVIPGMRKEANVRANLAGSAAGSLPAGLLKQLSSHRWDRKPAAWSS